MIPILQKLPVMLVVEDFHYLRENVQMTIFQQWKSFVDNEISVVVLGTTHHAVDIARSNRDLLGRILQIDVARWDEKDLAEIVSKGFNYLGIGQADDVTESIARESVGLPILAQQTCEQMLLDKNMRMFQYGTSIGFSTTDVEEALYRVANTRYRQLETYYQTIIQGPRGKARRYNTYELVLTCFAQEPVKFALTRYEIDQRLRKLPIVGTDIPPPASLTSMLKALKRFQDSSDMELLEWKENERVLYIMEPAFLFYIRWKEKQQISKMYSDIYERVRSILGKFQFTFLSAEHHVQGALKFTAAAKGEGLRSSKRARSGSRAGTEGDGV